jgi:hypothetical protein
MPRIKYVAAICSGCLALSVTLQSHSATPAASPSDVRTMKLTDLSQSERFSMAMKDFMVILYSRPDALKALSATESLKSRLIALGSEEQAFQDGLKNATKQQLADACSIYKASDAVTIAYAIQAIDEYRTSQTAVRYETFRRTLTGPDRQALDDVLGKFLVDGQITKSDIRSIAETDPQAIRANFSRFCADATLPSRPNPQPEQVATQTDR